jgi:hypothetical protein
VDRKADALFATPQLTLGTDSLNRWDPGTGIVSQVQNWLPDGLASQLAQQLAR